MNNQQKAAEIFGWYGTVAIVLTYVLVSFKIIPASRKGYIHLQLVPINKS